MRRIVYASASSQELTPQELDQLASEAKAKNTAIGMSGLLLYGDGSFFQVLEGPAAAIEELRQSIWCDPRHTGISMLQDQAIETVSFSDWSMGCFRLDAEQPSSALWPIVTFDTIESQLPAGVPPEITILARTFFTSIVRRGANPDPV